MSDWDGRDPQQQRRGWVAVLTFVILAIVVGLILTSGGH